MSSGAGGGQVLVVVLQYLAWHGGRSTVAESAKSHVVAKIRSRPSGLPYSYVHQKVRARTY